MPTNELHQEREQRSFQEVQQYFMKNLYNNPGFQGMGDGRMAQGNYRQNNFGGQRNYNRNDGRDNRQGGGKFNNNRGGNRTYNRQGGSNRDNMDQNQQQAQPIQVAQQEMTREEMQMLQQQQQQMGMQQLPQVDMERLNSLSPADRRQEIGNTIYQFIQAQYGELAGKITGMLLDNDRIVDSNMLVTDAAYLSQKAHEAYSLLSQQPAGQAQPAPAQ